MEEPFKDKFKIRTNLSWQTPMRPKFKKGRTFGIMLGLEDSPTFDNSAGYEFSDGSQRNYWNGGGYDNPYWAQTTLHMKGILTVTLELILTMNLVTRQVTYNAD